MGRKSAEDVSLRDALITGEPITRFFYEYQGERAVDPATMIGSGIDLWHERIRTNQVDDNSFLWDFAESLLESRQDTLMYSWAEWLRYQVMMGALVPPKWNPQKPYPYKGLLISAIYFQEASRLCAEKIPERAWHLVAMAYYHLGLNTIPSATENTRKAAMMLHAARTEKVRALVLGALDRIKRDGLADSIEKAKDEVSRLIREKLADRVVKDWLNEFDTLVSERTKGRTSGKQKNDVIARIRNMLDTWSLPSGPYPEIAKAFSPFNKKKTGAVVIVTDEMVKSEEVTEESSDCYLRIVNLLENGHVLTTEVSPQAAD